MKIVLVNKRFSPQRSATGYHAHQFAQYLNKQGHSITLLHTTQKNTLDLNATDSLNRKSIASHYYGKRILLRLISDFIDSIRLIYKARHTNADYYIILSDPPFLQLLSSYLLSSSKTIFWFMDIYPHAFVAHNLIDKRNILFLFFKKRLRVFKPKLVISLGKEQSKFLCHEFSYQDLVSVPVGLQKINFSQLTILPKWYEGNHLIYLIYKGNLGSAHDLSFLIELADKLDRSRHRFIISATGLKSNDLFKHVKNPGVVIYLDEIKEEWFQLIDIHVVTLLSQWTHICVPSKALMATSTKGTVLFHGTISSDTWTYIKDIGWHISDQYAQNNEILNFLKSITKEAIDQKKLKVSEVYEKLLDDLSKSYLEIESQMR